MNKQTFKGLAAVVALFAAGMVNAATVTLTPSSPTVINIDDTFTLTAGGSGFTDIGSGELTFTWDSSLLALAPTTTVTTIESAIVSAGFGDTITGFSTIILGTGTAFISMAADIGSPVIPPGGVINSFFTLDFIALAASPAIDLTTINATPSLWTTDAGGAIPIDPIIGATVNAVPVPAAVWLFGSGLIGLAGIARRSNTKALG